MLFPAHVEALRLEMVERVWKESTVVGPLPELMCDIMAYIPKPALTLDCPMEEIVLHIKKEPDFMLASDGVLSGVFGIFEVTKPLVVEQLLPPGGSITLARPFERAKVQSFYCDISTCRLYLLCNSNAAVWQLIEYCLKEGKVVKVYEMPLITDLVDGRTGTCVVGEHCFLNVSWQDRVEVLHVKLGDKRQCPTVILSVKKDHPDFFCVRLHPVSRAPVTIDVVYPRKSTERSVRLKMVRESSPFLFACRSRSLPEKDLACTPISGTNLYLCPTEGGLCFRNSRWRQKVTDIRV
ncbi:hypothetical protein FOZ60_001722 [Perkinsus olseni]|uniref:Uncharacterized protein n=1 Tax=Perkinsus olseni TaxID=32597 RepID=A0A7J6NZW5_PEROL|nr:hypothetical protein FOZ60_001722 [Perkinsus olseni]